MVENFIECLDRQYITAYQNFPRIILMYFNYLNIDSPWPSEEYNTGYLFKNPEIPKQALSA